MAMYRQTSGGNGPREGDVADYVSIGIRGGSRHFQPRRSKPPPAFGISLGLFFVTLSFVLSISALFYFILQSKVEITKHQAQEDNTRINAHFLTNATRTKASKGPKRNRVPSVLGSVDSIISAVENRNNKSSSHEPRSVLDRQGNGSSNEAERSEVKIHEAKNEASLNDTNKDGEERSREAVDDADEYDDGLDLHTEIVEELDNAGLEGKDSASTKPHTIDAWESSHVNLVEEEKQVTVEEVEEKASIDSSSDKTLPNPMDPRVGHHSERAGSAERPPARRLIPHKGKKPRHKHKVSAGTCAMRILNSTAMLVEPIESRKFARFALQYVEKEEKQIDSENWEPRFAGHQSRREREDSFIARDQKIKCGFVNGPDESQSTGFILAEDDKKYISTCHIAVSTCIFGNSDRLRSPMGKTVSRLSKKNVCFVMFVDEVTLQTLTSEGQMPDAMGFIGLWKILVVKNLPYSDMRRVGKIPKLLSHRLFPSARYSIWLDSKLRLQLDPLLILEYFLWRKGYEYAISNHYDRHCLWEEVAQNKRLNKYNHSIIDEQFSFYQADGMRRFNASDPDKLLPSNVPEGSFIIRAHTPMSNLFSCLWFNEVDRFTPRDQLSFAYTYHKLNRMNPEKPFYLNMFKDCERRKIAKLYRHRNEEKRTSLMSHIDL